jgi:hypothetical protein
LLINAWVTYVRRYAAVVRVECHVFKKSLTEFFDDKAGLYELNPVDPYA